MNEIFAFDFLCIYAPTQPQVYKERERLSRDKRVTLISDLDNFSSFLFICCCCCCCCVHPDEENAEEYNLECGQRAYTCIHPASVLCVFLKQRGGFTYSCGPLQCANEKCDQLDDALCCVRRLSCLRRVRVEPFALSFFF